MDDASSRHVSLDAFVRAHGLHLTKFAFLITGDRGRAEDLVQDVLFAMHRRFGPELAIEDPLRYARRSIVNANISRNRLRRVPELLSDDPPEPLFWDAGPMDRPDDDIWSALQTLPQRQRAVLVLRYYLGAPDHDIANLLGCREGSVRSSAARAFKALRPLLRSPDGVMGQLR